MNKVYAWRSHVGSIELLEDDDGVFWVDYDGVDMSKVDESDDVLFREDSLNQMRERGVAEDAVKRVLAQCNKGTQDEGRPKEA